MGNGERADGVTTREADGRLNRWGRVWDLWLHIFNRVMGTSDFLEM